MASQKTRMTQTDKRAPKHVLCSQSSQTDSQSNNNNGNSFLTCVKRHNSETDNLCNRAMCFTAFALSLTLCILFDLIVALVVSVARNRLESNGLDWNKAGHNAIRCDAMQCKVKPNQTNQDGCELGILVRAHSAHTHTSHCARRRLSRFILSMIEACRSTICKKCISDIYLQSLCVSLKVWAR